MSAPLFTEPEVAAANRLLVSIANSADAQLVAAALLRLVEEVIREDDERVEQRVQEYTKELQKLLEVHSAPAEGPKRRDDRTLGERLKAEA